MPHTLCYEFIVQAETWINLVLLMWCYSWNISLEYLTTVRKKYHILNNQMYMLKSVFSAMFRLQSLPFYFGFMFGWLKLST